MSYNMESSSTWRRDLIPPNNDRISQLGAVCEHYFFLPCEKIQWMGQRWKVSRTSNHRTKDSHAARHQCSPLSQGSTYRVINTLNYNCKQQHKNISVITDGMQDNNQYSYRCGSIDDKNLDIGMQKAWRKVKHLIISNYCWGCSVTCLYLWGGNSFADFNVCTNRAAS